MPEQVISDQATLRSSLVSNSLIFAERPDRSLDSITLANFLTAHVPGASGSMSGQQIVSAIDVYLGDALWRAESGGISFTQIPDFGEGVRAEVDSYLPSFSIGTFADVLITNPQDGDILVLSGSRFVNSQGGGGGTAGDAFTVVQTSTNYSSTPYTVQSGKDQFIEFTGNFANLINFPSGISENSYGHLLNSTGANMVITSSSGVTVNGVSNRTGGTALPLKGMATWVRLGTNNIFVFGELSELLALLGNLNANGQKIYGNLADAAAVSGTMSAASHSGKILRTAGNVTVPQTGGFNCTLISAGAHTVTFGATTSAAMAAGDIMSIIVDDTPAIHAVKTTAANKVSFT